MMKRGYIKVYKDLEKKKLYLKNYYLKNKDKIIKNISEYRLKNIDKFQKYQEEYRETHKEESKLYRKEYTLNKKEEIYKSRHEYYLKNKEDFAFRYEKNKDKIKKQQKLWRLNNKETRKKYMQNRIKNNVNCRVVHNISSRIRIALEGNPKLSTTKKLVGCSIKTLRNHLGQRFTKGMTWNNYGKWHIDHIKPCASFDLSKESEQHKCFHYTNLQPLWAKDNLSKNKYRR